jgi:hypothetical protein
MSREPWDDWSDAWKASPPQPVADVDEIERRIRRRVTWRTAQITADLIACVLATAVSVWSLSLGGLLRTALGSAGLAFSLFGFFVALGGLPSKPSADRSVVAALDLEIIEVKADIRRSLGGIAMAGAGGLFLGFCAVLIAAVDVMTPQRRWMTLATVAGMVGSALWSGWLMMRRRRRLRLLTALRDELAG